MVWEKKKGREIHSYLIFRFLEKATPKVYRKHRDGGMVFHIFRNVKFKDYEEMCTKTFIILTRATWLQPREFALSEVKFDVVNETI